MSHVPVMPPANRVYARIDRFQCECPKCGELILSWHRDLVAPARLHDLSHRRSAARVRHSTKALKQMTFNPHAQRLVCPSCRVVWVVGLLLYETRAHNRPLSEPADTIPTRRQLAELRRYAGGWWREQAYKNGDPVNLAIDNPCTCPRGGWAVACAVHGDPAQAKPTPVGNLEG